jgi:hypothetical protein
MVDEKLIEEKFNHLGAVAEITEMIYSAIEQEQLEEKYAHLGAVPAITEMLYLAKRS